MQCPPTSPGLKGRKFHFVPAASSTSLVSMPISRKILASSFTKAMLRSRWLFSITFAASATFEIFGRPLLARLSGREDLLPLRFPAELEKAFGKKGKERRYVRGVVKDGRVLLGDKNSSGQLRSAAGTNCLAEIPPLSEPLPAGTRVWVRI